MVSGISRPGVMVGHFKALLASLWPYFCFLLLALAWSAAGTSTWW